MRRSQWSASGSGRRQPFSANRVHACQRQIGTTLAGSDAVGRSTYPPGFSAGAISRFRVLAFLPSPQPEDGGVTCIAEPVSSGARQDAGARWRVEPKLVSEGPWKQHYLGHLGDGNDSGDDAERASGLDPARSPPGWSDLPAKAARSRRAQRHSER